MLGTSNIQHDVTDLSAKSQIETKKDCESSHSTGAIEIAMRYCVALQRDYRADAPLQSHVT